MSTPGFRSFSPAIQRFFVATVINMIGSAALFGFVLIYFHEVRGISLGQAGFAVGAMSFTMVILTPFAGSLSDHLGARLVLTMGCLVSIAAGVLYAFVTSFAAAVGVSVLLGIGNALWFPSQMALLALIVTPAERPAVSAFQRWSLNLGAALGGVLGGFIVRSESLASYRWLFLVNVATYVVFLFALLSMPHGRVAKEEHEDEPGFSAVLKDSFFVRLLATDICIALGFGFLFAFMPAYASTLGIGKATIGVLFAFGAASVVFTQIPTLRWSRGRHRMQSLAVMNLWFAAAFALMAVTPHVAVGVAIVAIAIGQIFGGFGESVLGAVRHPLTSDLAPPRLVGRYFGLSVMVFQACMGFANTIGGTVMQRSMTAVWLIPLGASLAGVVGTLSLRDRIPQNAAIS
ncbi:MAG TPA: MFS transporter, partial [Ilumatobacteraceae bacterium]|nr:MFS transporter [Ilumatobacteraceae bacterium]